jgi:hypothetical protein
VRPHSRQSKIDAFLDFLRREVGLKFQEPAASKKYRKLAAKLRNDFAHGDWERFTKSLSQLDLSRAFGAVSKLFHAIDVANGSKRLLDRIDII